MQSFFETLGRFTYQQRKLIVFFWIILVLSLLVFSMKLPEKLQGSGFEMNGEYEEVNQVLKDTFNYPESSLIIMFESEKFNPADDSYHQEVESLLDSIMKNSNAESVISPYELPDMIKEDRAYAIVSFNQGMTEIKSEISLIKNLSSNTKDIKASVTGSPVIMEDMNDASQQDLFRAEMIGLPAALLILILAFGGLVAAALPLVIGLISVVITTAIAYFIGDQMELSVFVLNVIPMIGLALGIDFALLLVNRFREELKSKTVEEAIVKSVSTAGRAIAFSGLCVFVGLSGMMFIKVNIFQSIGIGAMLVVSISVLCALTFLPALLAVIGTSINKLSLFKVNNKGEKRWYKFASIVMKRPVVMLVVATTILLISTFPVLDSHFTIPEEDALPKYSESRIAIEKYEETFGDHALPSVLILVKSEKEMNSLETLTNLQTFVNGLKDDVNVDRAVSIFEQTNLGVAEILTLLSDTQNSAHINQMIKKDQTVVKVFLNIDANSKEAQNWIAQLKENHYEGLSIKVGGEAKFYEEIYSEISQKAPLGLLFVLISTYILLLLAFKSVLLPLKAIIMNVLSLTATFGILVFIFQSEYMYNMEGIYLIIPVFIFCLVFGLSMDYEVFLISRIQEYYLETKDNDYATLMGLTSTSKIITSAALIMIVITGAFAFTDIMPVKQMGLGIAIAIFIDATIVRMMLVPPLMKLLGDWNWWMPKFSRSKQPSQTDRRAREGSL
jgi:putative drug exporter of the RND superfamily